jgi:hypothetical protein
VDDFTRADTHPFVVHLSVAIFDFNDHLIAPVQTHVRVYA